MLIYKNAPPQNKSWREDINKQTGFPPNQCTYCTHLAGFYTDDTSPWVLSSIHIQRDKLTRHIFIYDTRTSLQWYLCDVFTKKWWIRLLNIGNQCNIKGSFSPELTGVSSGFSDSFYFERHVSASENRDVDRISTKKGMVWKRGNYTSVVY